MVWLGGREPSVPTRLAMGDLCSLLGSPRSEACFRRLQLACRAGEPGGRHCRGTSAGRDGVSMVFRPPRLRLGHSSRLAKGRLRGHFGSGWEDDWKGKGKRGVIYQVPLLFTRHPLQVLILKHISGP